MIVIGMMTVSPFEILSVRPSQLRSNSHKIDSDIVIYTH